MENIMLYHAFNNYKMIPVLVALIAAIVTQGCARHSSENMDKSELRFYGNPTDNGDDFIHEEAPNSVFADGLSCSQFQNMGAALNYRTCLLYTSPSPRD